MSEITGTRSSCSVERRGQSQYEIIYRPTIKGRHQLHIKVQGQHIRGGPLSLAAKLPVEKLGDPVLTILRVDDPCGVAVNQRGEVVVAGGMEIACLSSLVFLINRPHIYFFPHVVDLWPRKAASSSSFKRNHDWNL